MPINKNDFLKGAKRARIAGGSGVGPKIITNMKPDTGYSLKELTAFAGVEKIKNILNYLEYRQKKLESRVVNGEKFYMLVVKTK
jgi:hypothetical protein